ncbi:DUF3016 domain-containing protein [Algiphilus sp. W345]|uniref:DUF3016 domain-containing protein n=1 Tax=Banduia mediterranea TaxID=3075609 RepID=A0ABU2WEY8_9GAMM|nr:DUF3016 domain-containing protein [Algiphilus sp. W345]MDT0496093.1 DUF3016 domain-containing protein [Algiphilus sp. W345]
MFRLSTAWIGMALIGSLVPGGPVWAEDAAPTAIVAVSYKNPEKFTDASDRGLYSPRATESVMRRLTAHFQEQGAKYLAEGQTMEIEVTDIDLAGRFEPGHTPGYEDVRLLRESTWPRMEFNYVVKQGEEIVDSGEAKLSDMSYLMHSSVSRSSDPLHHDTQMIDRWFRKHFEARSEATASATEPQ